MQHEPTEDEVAMLRDASIRKMKWQPAPDEPEPRPLTCREQLRFMGVALREARKNLQAVNWAHGQREGDRLIRTSIILLYSVMERLVIEPQDAPDEWLEVIRAYRHAMVYELENQGLLPVLTRRKVDGAITHQCGEHSVLMRRTDATAK